MKQLFDLEKIKSLIYGKNDIKVFKLVRNKIEYDPNFKENFKAENLLFKNRDEKLEDVAKNFARFFIQGKNKKLEKKLLKNLKIKFI